MSDQSADSDGLTVVSAYIGSAGIRVHYARCEPCMYGDHDGGPHDWAGPEDIAYAASIGQPNPSGQPCGCHCRTEPPRIPEEPDFDAIQQTTCDLCGEVGACAYDSEGRPLIHAEVGSDD